MTIWRPGPFNGAPMGNCGCGCSSGFGAAGGSGRRYPTIEATLSDYVAAKLAAGQYFYITPQLNSSVLQPSTFGDVSTLLDPSSISIGGGSSDGSTVSDAISNASTSIGDFFGSALGNTAPTTPLTTTDPLSGITDWTTSIGNLINSTTAPPAVTGMSSDLKAPVANAATMDLFGVPVSPWVVGGAVGLVLLAVLISAAPKKSGRRRK